MQNEESRLRSDTPERQDVEELVADGMDDEANVDAAGDGIAEEAAVREIASSDRGPSALDGVSESDERNP